MEKKIAIFLLLSLLSSYLALSVDSFRKISETEGNFSAILDDEDVFGISISSIGDFNGDNITDIVVGAFQDDDDLFGTSTNKGAVYILFLNSDGTVNSFQKISDTQGNFEGNLNGDDRFGVSVSSLGDLNRDGITDIAVGAFLDDDGGNGNSSNRGAVYILFLNSNGTVNSFQKISDTQGNFEGNLDDGDQFGISISSIGDLNGDNITDIVVGAFLDDDDGGTDKGAVYILFLNSNGTVNSFQKISDTEGNFGGNLDDGDLFGRSIFSIGDLNGDGITDIVVGAQSDDDGGTNRGAVYILFLNSNGTVNSFQKISDTQGTFSGNLNDEDVFGVSVSSLGDLNGDGITDIAVGAIFDDDGSNTASSNRGAVYILFLNSDGTVNSFQKISDTQGNFGGNLDDGDQFGISISVDSNNNNNIFVGAPLDDDGGMDKGAIYRLNLEICGNSNLNTDFEECDDGNFINRDGCSSNCEIETGFQCNGNPSICIPICGDSIATQNEECDDGNPNNGDGCSSNCEIEIGFQCGSICTSICGDGMIVGQETCDDSNNQNGDGCSSLCSNESSNSSNSLSIRGIVGIVVGIVIFLCILILTISIISFFIFKKLKSKSSNSIELEAKVPILKNIEIGEVIGKGAFGQVYEGNWNNTQVALKSIQTDNIEEIANELNLMVNLRHPNVLQFFGIYYLEKEQKPTIVTEFMEKGDLLNFLHSEAELQIQDLIDFCKQISIGMEYLHSQNILHRDLACRNILVSTGKKESFIIKISDFGLSRKSEEYYKLNSKKIPVRWTAPEVIEFGKTFQSSDVWSFGIVLWEIFSRGGIPYAGMKNQKVIEKVKSGFRLNPPRETPFIISKIMKECWSENHEERPPFSEISKRLETISESDFKNQNLSTNYFFGSDIKDENSTISNEGYNFPPLILESSDAEKLKELVYQLKNQLEKGEKEISRLRNELSHYVSPKNTYNNQITYNNE